MSWEKGKTSPVAGTSMTIPWSIAEEAYLGYSPNGRYSQTLLRLAERGGFHVSELDKYVPSWREKTSEITRLRAELATLTAERDRYKVALQFYANEKHYDEDAAPGNAAFSDVHGEPTEYDFEPDWGHTARVALATTPPTSDDPLVGPEGEDDR